MGHQERVAIEMQSRSTRDITQRVQSVVDNAKVDTAICTVFIQHTSASLVITENADPDVRVDLETWMNKAVRDGDPDFIHTAEGEDDMSAHVRSLLTETALTIPV
ncbi:MAG: YjbQ family protein, partial [Clostridia bacterium]|nr:YjbQ family protein [Deltaproteobacteria bacterium]